MLKMMMSTMLRRTTTMARNLAVFETLNRLPFRPTSSPCHLIPAISDVGRKVQTSDGFHRKSPTLLRAFLRYDVASGDEGLEISKLGIDKEIVSALAKKEITKLFPIQAIRLALNDKQHEFIEQGFQEGGLCSLHRIKKEQYRKRLKWLTRSVKGCTITALSPSRARFSRSRGFSTSSSPSSPRPGSPNEEGEFLTPSQELDEIHKALEEQEDESRGSIEEQEAESRGSIEEQEAESRGVKRGRIDENFDGAESSGRRRLYDRVDGSEGKRLWVSNGECMSGSDSESLSEGVSEDSGSREGQEGEGESEGSGSGEGEGQGHEVEGESEGSGSGQVEEQEEEGESEGSGSEQGEEHEEEGESEGSGSEQGEEQEEEGESEGSGSEQGEEQEKEGESEGSGSEHGEEQEEEAESEGSGSEHGEGQEEDGEASSDSSSGTPRSVLDNDQAFDSDVDIINFSTTVNCIA